MAREKRLAIVALTRPGLQTALRLAGSLPEGTPVFAPASLAAGGAETDGEIRVDFYSGGLPDFLGRFFTGTGA